MTRYLIDSMGFNNAVRVVATLVAVTSLFSLIFSRPNPAHTHPRPQSYRALRTWIDPEALNNKAFIWFTIAVAFLFFGFYPIFFNLEEVRPKPLPFLLSTRKRKLTITSSVGRRLRLRHPQRL
jgi:hypothetical protein